MKHQPKTQTIKKHIAHNQLSVDQLCKLYKYMAKNNMFDKLLKQAEEADKKPKK